jgi:Flp pilus assembly protein TadG
MIKGFSIFTALCRDERGAMMIETAIIAPLLILMSMGAFQISEVIARQTELQGAMAEATSIALSAPPTTADQRTVLKDVIVASTGLDAAKVTLTEKFRCGAATTYVSAADSCVGTKVAHFLLVEIDDTYTPVWTQWGFGEPLEFNVNRYVMIKQS